MLEFGGAVPAGAELAFGGALQGGVGLRTGERGSPSTPSTPTVLSAAVVEAGLYATKIHDLYQASASSSIQAAPGAMTSRRHTCQTTSPEPLIQLAVNRWSSSAQDQSALGSAPASCSMHHWAGCAMVYFLPFAVISIPHNGSTTIRSVASMCARRRIQPFSEAFP